MWLWNYSSLVCGRALSPVAGEWHSTALEPCCLLYTKYKICSPRFSCAGAGASLGVRGDSFLPGSAQPLAVRLRGVAFLYCCHIKEARRQETAGRLLRHVQQLCRVLPCYVRRQQEAVGWEWGAPRGRCSVYSASLILVGRRILPFLTWGALPGCAHSW